MNAVPIGDLTESVKTWNPRRQPDVEFIYIDLSAVDNSTKTITASTPVVGSEAPSRARQLVAAGDVLVSTVRPNLNAVAVVPAHFDGATASTGFTVLRPTSQVDGRYLFHWVRSPEFIGDMVRKATGASYPAVSDRIVRDSQIPAPRLPEQRRIAAILDHADALTAKRRQVLTHADALTQSIFHDMFGDPVDNPHSHPLHELDELIEEGRPITYGILKPGPEVAGGVPYVRVADMRNGGIDLVSVRRTSVEISNSYRRSILRTGDLLMSIRGHVGRFAHVPAALDGANITQDSARLSITSTATSQYVRAAMSAAGLQRWMARHTKGVAVRGLNIGDLRRVPIPLPPLALQQKFASRAAAVQTVRSRATGHEVEELFTSLQYRAFRGEL